MSRRFCASAALAVAALPVTLLAQQPSPSQGHGSDAEEGYRSAFASYRAYADVGVAPWLDVNRTVAAAASKPGSSPAGAEHAHDAGTPANASSSQPARPSAQRGMHGHGGHGMAK